MIDDDLDTFFEGETVTETDATVAEPEAAPEPLEPAEEAPTEAEPAETEETTGEIEAAPPAAEREPAHIPIAALMDERERRQAAERQLAELNAEPKPDFYEDPEQAFAQHQQETAASMENVKVDMSVEMSRMMHEDYDEKLQVWSQMSANNSLLYDQAAQSAHPGEFAYQAAKNQMAIAEMGNPTEYREKLKAELKLELEADAKAKADADQAARSAIPKSLADDRNVGGRGNPVEPDHTPLDAIF
jgi:hypothetical protein